MNEEIREVRIRYTLLMADDTGVFHNTPKEVRQLNSSFFQTGSVQLTAAFSCVDFTGLIKLIYLELKGLSMVTLLANIPLGYFMGWLFKKAFGRKDKEKEQLLLQLKQYQKLYMKMERTHLQDRRARIDARNDLGRANARLQRMERGYKKLASTSVETSELGKQSARALYEEKLSVTPNNKNSVKSELSVVSDSEKSFRVELAMTKAKLSIMDDKLLNSAKELASWKDKASEEERELTEALNELASFKNRTSEKERQLTEALNELASWKDKASEKERQLADTLNELSVVSDNETSVRVELALAKAKLSITDDKLLNSAKELASWKDKASEKERELAEALNELVSWKNEASENERQLADASNELALTKAKLDVVEDQLLNSTKEMTLLHEQILNKDEELAVKDNKVSSLNEDIREKEKELAVANNKVSSMNEDIQKKEKELALANNEVTSLHDQFVREVKEIEIAKKGIFSLNEALRKRGKELKLANNEVVLLSNKLSAMNEMELSLRAELLKAREKDCKECKGLRKMYQDLMSDYENQDKFRRIQLNKVRLQTDVYLQVANDRKWQNDILRERYVIKCAYI
ncbi:interaptin-like [Orbicella faveolata]|uniref:interaptin-like n=1 Tax=Orbicella faveolata TaxID=48498 RepID=UPI0009E468EC|nr:interaptin-like [Orbicella faveolata]